jgi:hypothetical protein
MSKEGQWGPMMELVTDEMVTTIGVFGSPAEVARQVVDRFGSFCDRVCLYFPGYHVDDEVIAEVTAEIHQRSTGS